MFELLFDVFKKDITVTRYTTGAYINGIWQPSEDSSFLIRASIQPASQKEAVLTEAGKNLTDHFLLYTFETLQIAISDTDIPSDQVTYKTKRYELVTKIEWENNVINNNVYLIKLLA